VKQPGIVRIASFALLSAYGIASVACVQRAANPAGASPVNAADAQAARTEVSRTSASQVVTFAEAERGKYSRVEFMIQARFSGVQVTQNGNAFSIRIRGTGSFASSNEPLVIIDGANFTTADLGSVNPKDVVRIEVMKDSAAALYGVRGANGVIVITTRRGT
jgi:TonB-dependent SusC/RagA subfamily outer membrane receptor